MTLDDFNVGDRVRYVPYHAHGDQSHNDCEDGIVTSKNDKFVFVRFSLFAETSKACNPDQLRRHQ
jgi:hypothetical protein